jgi:hypothetical protein
MRASDLLIIGTSLIDHCFRKFWIGIIAVFGEKWQIKKSANMSSDSVYIILIKKFESAIVWRERSIYR